MYWNGLPRELPALELFKKPSRHGTLKYGLVGVVVFSQRLESMTLEVFSNLNDSIKAKSYIA